MAPTPYIHQADKYQVVQRPCPHFGPVLPSAWKVPTGVLHTTECSFKAAQDEFDVKWAPHFELGLVNGRVLINQLVPVGYMGASLVSHNNQVLVQVEMVAYSQEKPWLPDDLTLDALASLMNACHDQWGIPLSHPWPDGDYGRYGDNPHRHAGKFGVVPGWYGHADVPYPDAHWDPGNLKFSAVFERCRTLSAPPKPAPPATPVA